MVLRPVPDPRVVTCDGVALLGIDANCQDLFRRVVCRSVPFGTMRNVPLGLLMSRATRNWIRPPAIWKADR